MSQLIPELHRPETHDPLAPDLHADFPHAEAQSRLDGISAELPAGEFEALGFALGEIFRWCCAVKLDDLKAQERIGRRLIAIAWATNPALLEDQPSLTALARKFGISPGELSKHTSEASRKFGVENRFRAHSRHRLKGSP